VHWQAIPNIYEDYTIPNIYKDYTEHGLEIASSV